MTAQERFFFNNAGWSFNPQAETSEEGHARCAAQLARAKNHADAQGWTYQWVLDEPGFEEEGAEAEVCHLYDAEDVPLASLCGIVGATGDYRRVVEAELALEAMTRQDAATGPQEPQEAAVKAAPRYTVNLHVISLHGGERVREVYQGGDETVMYSHVSAIEWTLAMTGGTAEIEIVEDGRERWIDYQDGKRDGLPQEAE